MVFYMCVCVYAFLPLTFICLCEHFSLCTQENVPQADDRPLSPVYTSRRIHHEVMQRPPVGGWSWACGALSAALITLSFQPRRRGRLIDLPGHWSLDSFVSHMSKGRWHLQPCEVTASSSPGSPEVINVYLKGRVLPNRPLSDDRKRAFLLLGSLFPPPLTHAVKKKQINDTICPTNHISGSRHNGEKLLRYLFKERYQFK